MTPKQRAYVQVPGRQITWPATLTEEQALDAARATMICETCYWWTDYHEPCAEQKYVRGCIHWKRGSK
jgi:hypothetical protein